MNKCLLFSIILFLSSTLLADVKTFNINDYTVDIANRTVRYIDESAIDKHDRRYGWIFPVHTEIIHDAENYPKYIDDSTMVIDKVFVSLAKSDNKPEKFSHIRPIEFGGRGIVRHDNVVIFESCPFFFVGQDSLFFATRVEYTLTDTAPDFPAKITTKYQITEKIDMVIITPQKYQNTFERFKNFKEKMGLSTIIKTVEEIYSEYEGENTVMQIRNYIKDLYFHNDIDFVVIGGDYSIVPIGYAYPYEGKDIIATDAFYSKLDGDPDNNSNGVYFEQYDYADYYADVFVGRFTGSNESELNTLIDKQIDYFTGNGNQRAGFNTSLFLAGLNVNEPYDGESWCEQVKWEFPNTFSIDSMYEQSSSNFGQQTLLNALNIGYNIYYHQSHGDYNKVKQNGNNWALWSDNFYNLNAVSGLYMISSCHPGDIGFSGLSQKAMINPNGGCVNYIGSSSEELPGAAAGMHSVFFNQILKGKTLGESLMLGNLLAYGNLLSSPFARYMTYSYNIQGDPSSKLFLNDPRNISILGINQFKKGNGSINGVFNMVPNETVEITLISNGEIVSKTSTDNQSFSLEYDNLFSDSVYVYYHSQECYLKEYGYLVQDNDSIEIEISNLSIDDSNGSSIVEAGEDFSIAFDMNATLNSSNIDSMIVYLSDISDTNLVALNNSVKISIAELNTVTPYTIFNLHYSLDNRAKQDSVSKCSIYFQTTSGELVYNTELYIPVADPMLKLQSINYLGSNVLPTFINDSKGTIDKAEITIYESVKGGFNTKATMVLYDIDGLSVVQNDTLDFAVDLTKTYFFEITINDEYTYNTSDFKVYNSQTSNIILNADYSPENVNLEWTHDLIGDFKYNIYIDTDINFTNPVLKNFKPLNTTSYSFNDDQSSTLYIKIAVVDTNNVEFFRSEIKQIDFIPLYQDKFKISQYQLFNPMFINNKLISNVLNSSVSAINSDGTLPNGNGIIHEAEVNGFAVELQQGFAIGDINGDGFDDMINYSYNVGDSTLVKVIDLQTGTLIASKNIYGFVMENAPVIVDNNDDGQKEIIMSTFKGGTESYLHMMEFVDGDLYYVVGFPLILNNSSYYIHSPSLIDLDGNGSKELIVDNYSSIFVYDTSNFNLITEYSLSLGIQTSLSYCDFDEDGQIEIFAISESSDVKGKLYGYKFNGTTLIEIPEILGGISLDMKSPSLYDLTPPVSFPDLDDDSTVDIVVLTALKLYIYDNQFNSRVNFPIDLDPRIETNNSSAPSFGDFDGDTILDILFMDANYRVWCYSGITGLLLEGFPIQIEDMTRKEMTALPIMDLDGDNDLEFAVGVPNGVMLVYDYPTTTTRLDTYDKYRGDQFNSGFFGTILGVPSNIVTVQNGTDLDISWDPVATATSYKIFVSDDPYTGFTELYETSNTNYTVIGTTEDKKFYYIVAVK